MSALNLYRQSITIERNASAVQDQLKTLRETLESSLSLKRFIDPRTEEHLYAGPMMRVIDRIYDLEATYPENIDHQLISNLIQSSISETDLLKCLKKVRGKKISHLLDANKLLEQLHFLEFGIREAIREIELENKSDNGGPNVHDSLNVLLIKLDKIYQSSDGKKQTFERFCTCLIELLPDDIRPNLPQGQNSIRRRKNRLTSRL